MFRSPFPRPESEAVHVVDLLVEEPVMVHTGSPPCLKCALAPYAAVAVMPRAKSTATARIVRRIPTSLASVPSVSRDGTSLSRSRITSLHPLSDGTAVQSGKSQNAGFLCRKLRLLLLDCGRQTRPPRAYS